MKNNNGTNFFYFLSREMVVIIIFILAIISSTFYALYLNGTGNNIFFVVNQYFEMEHKGSITPAGFGGVILSYCKRIGFIWLLGSFALTLPLSLLVLFIMIFTYGFTTTCFILLYGLKGAIAAFLLYGIQAILMVSIGGYLSIQSIRKNGGEATGVKKAPFYIGMIVSLGVVLAAILDVWSVLNFDLIARLIL